MCHTNHHVRPRVQPGNRFTKALTQNVKLRNHLFP